MNTTAQAVSKTIANLGLGYERYNGDYGYKVEFDKNEGCIIVMNYHYAQENALAKDLQNAGYNAKEQNAFCTFVYGKVGA